jgi:vitamin B12 transporter
VAALRRLVWAEGRENRFFLSVNGALTTGTKMFSNRNSSFKLCLSISVLNAASSVLNVDLARAAEPENNGGVGEVVITATIASRDVLGDLRGVSRSEIQPLALETQQVRIVSDVLREVPGVAVSRSGSLGGFTQVRIRGGESNHTLVLIDGMEVGDPFSGEFDFSTLIADDVAQIEVLRGQQSALYGSDAIGGVVHYITPSGRNAPGMRARAEGGSFGTYSAAARVGGFTDMIDYVVSGSYYRTDGVVVAREGSQKIGSKNLAASAKFVLSPRQNLRMTGVGRYSALDADAPTQSFSGPDFGFIVDGHDTTATDSLYGLLKGELDLLDGDWTHAVTLQGVQVDTASADSGVPNFKTSGSRRKISYASTYFFATDAADHSITLALDNERESFRNVPIGTSGPTNAWRVLTTNGFVAEYNLNLNNRFGIGTAYRHDWNTRFQDADTYRLSGSYRLSDGFRVHASAGTGFKAPTNFELFGFDPGNFIGNPNLKPELSKGWEFGVQQDFNNGVTIGAVYFSNIFENEIFTDFPAPSFIATPDNRTFDSKQRGAELFASVALDNGVRFDGSYTYLDAKEGGVEEIRRAPHIASGTISWRGMEERFGAFLSIRYNGRQKDMQFLPNFPFSTAVTLPSFTLVNIGADWSLNEHVEVFGRVENLFDQRYEEVFSYRSPGRAFYFGIRGNV